ncbi:MAG: hypothetical protein Q9227_007328 [Pyrenula ochraceoflavens]
MSKRTSLGQGLGFIADDPQWRRACSYVHSIFDTYIDRAIAREQERAERPFNSEAKEDLHSTSKEGTSTMFQEIWKSNKDCKFLRDQLLNVFLGAKDTATIGISDVFFHLARHPNVWHKLRQEVLQHDVLLDTGSFSSLKYLQAVLQESLRLLSPVDVSFRTCIRDCVLPAGGGTYGDFPFYVQRGSRIESRIGVVHRDNEIWGEDAESFVPERWLDGSSKPVYIPFLEGGRTCPSQQMTMVQYAWILIRFAQQFEAIDNRDDTFEFIEDIKFGKQSKNGVRISLRQRLEQDLLVGAFPTFAFRYYVSPTDAIEAEMSDSSSLSSPPSSEDEAVKLAVNKPTGINRYFKPAPKPDGIKEASPPPPTRRAPSPPHEYGFQDNSDIAVSFLKTLILWALASSDAVQAIIKDSYKQARHEDDKNQPLSVQSWGRDGYKRRYWLVEGQDDTHFRLYRENSGINAKTNTWWSVAGTIEEIKAVAEKLDEENTPHARTLRDRIRAALPRFEAGEDKRKRRDYRQARKAAFARPEPGYSIYEGRTRGKRMRYTYSDDEADTSDVVSTRRSDRQSGVSTPAEVQPTVTASGRHVRSKYAGTYGESIMVDNGTRLRETTGQVMNGRSTRSTRQSASSNLRGGHRQTDQYDSDESMEDEPETPESGHPWDNSDNDDDAIDFEGDDEDEGEDRDDFEMANEDLSEPRSLIVKLPLRKASSSFEQRPNGILKESEPPPPVRFTPPMQLPGNDAPNGTLPQVPENSNSRNGVIGMSTGKEELQSKAEELSAPPYPLKQPPPATFETMTPPSAIPAGPVWHMSGAS